jgi:hypothetical protein
MLARQLVTSSLNMFLILFVLVLPAVPLSSTPAARAVTPPDFLLDVVPGITSVDLSWTSQPGVECYYVEKWDDINSFSFVVLEQVNSQTTRYLVTDLRPGQHYTFRIEALLAGTSEKIATPPVEVTTHWYQVLLPMVVH